MSLGLFSFLPSNWSASTVREPSFSMRNTVRPPHPAASTRYSKSSASPSALADGLSTTSSPPLRFHFQIVSPMMSTNVSSFLRLSHTGPSPKMMSRAMMSSGGFFPTMRSPSGVSMSTSIFKSSNDPCMSNSLHVGTQQLARSTQLETL